MGELRIEGVDDATVEHISDRARRCVEHGFPTSIRETIDAHADQPCSPA